MRDPIHEAKQREKCSFEQQDGNPSEEMFERIEGADQFGEAKERVYITARQDVACQSQTL